MNKILPCLAALALAATGAQAQLTVNSPTGAPLPGSVTVVGGIVLDLVGTNNNRVVSQLSASSLYVGYSGSGTPVPYRGNPLTIGIQTGFNAGVISALGGGLSKVAIRVTLEDGDTSFGNFDEDENSFFLNGFNFGNWSDVATVTHNSTGTSFGSTSFGFRDNTLDTGFFYSNDASLLSDFYNSLVTLGQVTYQLTDVDAGDNYYDFTQGLDADLIDIGTGPVVQPGGPTAAVPEPSTYGMIGAAALLGLVAYRRRAAKKAAQV